MSTRSAWHKERRDRAIRVFESLSARFMIVDTNCSPYPDNWESIDADNYQYEAVLDAIMEAL